MYSWWGKYFQKLQNVLNVRWVTAKGKSDFLNNFPVYDDKGIIQRGNDKDRVKIL